MRSSWHLMGRFPALQATKYLIAKHTKLLSRRASPHTVVCQRGNGRLLMRYYRMHMVSTVNFISRIERLMLINVIHCVTFRASHHP
jgi:hypothetical protein